MYSMHHRNSAACGREAEGKEKERNKGEERKRRKKRRDIKIKENKKLKKCERGREEKKIRKERGYVGILKRFLPLYSTGCSNLCNMMEGINKSLVS